MDDSTANQKAEAALAPAMSSWTRADWGIAVLLFAVVLGAYANSLPNEFVYDDLTIVVNDTRSHSLSRIDELFSGGYWQITKRPLYRPLTHLSFALNHAVTGLWAPGYRVVNLVLHALVCVVVYQLGRRFLHFRVAAAAGAVLYAVHPIHVEAVVPIVGRSELLSGLFVLLGLLLYMQDSDRGRAGVTWRYVLVVVLMWASMLCKESGIVLIGLVVVYDVWRHRSLTEPKGRRAWERFLVGRFTLRYLGMLAAIVVVLAMRSAAIDMLFGEGISFPKVDNPLVEEGFGVRLLTGFVLFGKYVWLLLIGYPLSCDYSYNAIPLPTGLTWPVVWGALCAVAALACGILSWCRRGVVALLILWFLVCYAPVANVLVLIGTLFAERLVYLPSAPLAVLVGVAVDQVLRFRTGAVGVFGRGLSNACLVIVAVWLVVLGVLTVARNPVWRNSETLFRDALAKQPGSARCHNNYGTWLLEHGATEAGIKHLERAVEIAGPLYVGRAQLAKAYATQGDWDKVVAVLRSLYEDVDSPSPHVIGPWLMYAAACEQVGQIDRAADIYRRVEKYDSNNVAALTGLAKLLADPNHRSLYDPSEAWQLAQTAANAHPKDPAALLRAAEIGVDQGRWIEAQQYHGRAYGVLKQQAEAAKGGDLERIERARLRSLLRRHNDLAEQIRTRRRHRREMFKPATTSATSTRPAARLQPVTAPRPMSRGNRD